MAKIYLAGGLFNAGERIHNLYLEKHLKALGHEVILPQREALKYYEDCMFDIDAVQEDCKRHATDPMKICVVNADGADSDSGACVEYGMAITATGRAIVYRTDFRTAVEKEVGVNAMLRGRESVFVYSPCHFTELDEAEIYYEELARKIHGVLVVGRVANGTVGGGFARRECEQTEEDRGALALYAILGSDPSIFFETLCGLSEKHTQAFYEILALKKERRDSENEEIDEWARKIVEDYARQNGFTLGTCKKLR